MQVDVRYPVEALAADIAEARDADRLRLVFEFVARWNDCDVDERMGVAAAPPPSTGDRRWDALLAGLVEHLSDAAGISSPTWIDEPGRFVPGAWWVVDTPLMRVWALHDTPAALLRHGVMLSRADLERV